MKITYVEVGVGVTRKAKNKFETNRIDYKVGATIADSESAAKTISILRDQLIKDVNRDIHLIEG